MTNNEFYRAFEDKHRGSRETITRRLRSYLPFVAAISALDTDCRAIDLGCGRGEWLELLASKGIKAHGVDLDDGMLAACRQLGLSVETGEAIAFLKGLPDQSQSIISGFHIVEHIPFERLQELIREALRVLEPAGLLILETPNPENIVVGTANFYMDPSHQRPIPQQLLSFLTEFTGFFRTKVLRLQESVTLDSNPAPTLLDVLSGVSPDYAVIAQKSAEAELLKHFDELFNMEFGLTLNTLANRFDARVQRAENAARQAESALNAIHSSYTWRYSKPVRMTEEYFRRIMSAYRDGRLLTGIKKRLKQGHGSVSQTLDNTAREQYTLYIPTASKPITQNGDLPPSLRIALDMYVLGQGVKTGVYRVCDELFNRLIRHPAIDPRYLIRKPFQDGIERYIAEKHLPEQLQQAHVNTPSDITDVLLSPFGPALGEWHNDPGLLHAHIIYDLIAIKHPEYFTTEAALEVRKIVECLNRQTVIFAISQCTKIDLLTFRPDLSPGQVVVIPLAADARFKPCVDQGARTAMRDRYGIPQNVPYVLSLATLEIRKNLEQTVRAFARFLDNNPQSNARLVLAGMTGWKLEKLHAEIAKTGTWASRILLIGFVDDGDLPALYSDALCFVYMSRYEGFGLPPLEAMACGTTVICSNNSSLPEVVGDAGMMFDPDDTAGVAQAITDLEYSTDLRDHYSQKGLARASLFSWERCCDIVVSTLKDRLQK